MTPSPQFSRETFEDVTVVVASGEIDVANVNEFKAFLENSADVDGPGLVVDLTRTTYFDSRTIATLADFSTRMRITRQRLAIVISQDGFGGRLLRIAGMTMVIPTLTELKDAVSVVKHTA
ncbi:MAG TPA: STAS domain-containing protein [Candidatus Binatus sp.]|nr:STAS domain-containing protein [Candidatus Binatus sp.]